MAHFVRDTVREALDLSAILDTYTEEHGYPPYHSGRTVGLLLYGYSRGLNGPVANAKALSFMARKPYPPSLPLRPWSRLMILSATTAKLKQRAKADFRGRHFETTLFVQAMSWYPRYALNYRDIEELFLERGLEVDH